MVTTFFISYTGSDEPWAVWVADALERAGYLTRLQAWDFRPGSNFVVEMQRAASEADRTIAILSRAFLESRFTPAEWAAAFVRDPRGETRSLVPIRVEDVEPPGLLGPIVYIDLHGLDEERARQVLLAGIKEGRGRPTAPPPFPGAGPLVSPPFPGHGKAGLAEGRRDTPLGHIPRLKRVPSGLEKARALRAVLDDTDQAFAAWLRAFEGTNPGTATDLQRLDAQTISAVIEDNGRTLARCRIWLGFMLGPEQLFYAEDMMGFGSTNAFNDAIRVRDSEGHQLRFQATMPSFNRDPGLDPDALSASEVPLYLWHRFTWRLR